VRLSFDDDPLDLRATRLASEPLRRLAPLSATQGERAESALTLDDTEVSRQMSSKLVTRKQRIPGAQEGEVAVYLGDSIFYRADHKALQSTFAY
jgi:hypothetical protein